MVRDPVCGMEVDPEATDLTAEYGERSYFFCSRRCQKAFVGEPERYVDGDSRGHGGHGGHHGTGGGCCGGGMGGGWFGLLHLAVMGGLILLLLLSRS